MKIDSCCFLKGGAKTLFTERVSLAGSLHADGKSATP